MRIELDTLLEHDIIQPNKITELICEGVSIFKGYSDDIAYFADKYTFVKFNKDLCEGFNQPTYRIEVKEKNPVAEGFVSKFGIKNKHDLEEAIKWLSYYPKDDQPKLLEEIKILSELFFDKGASAKIAKTNITDKAKDVDTAGNEENSLEEEIISENKQQVMKSITKTNERNWKNGHKEETTTPNGTKLKVSIPEVPTSDYEDTNSKFHKLVQGRVNGIEHRQGYDFTPEEREKAYDRVVAEEKHKLEKDAFKKAKAESEELKGFRNKANQQKHKLEQKTQTESYEFDEDSFWDTLYEESVVVQRGIPDTKVGEVASGFSLSKARRFEPEYIIAKKEKIIKNNLLWLILTPMSAIGVGIAGGVLGGLVGGPAGAAIGASYGTLIGGGYSLPISFTGHTIRTRKNQERYNSEKFKALLTIAKNDPECNRIEKLLKAELLKTNPDKRTLKNLRSQFRDAFEIAKNKEIEKLKDGKPTELKEEYLLDEDFAYLINESRDAKKVEKAMFTPDRTELEDGDAAGREKLKDNGYELSDILESLRVELLETPMVSHADNNESKEDFDKIVKKKASVRLNRKKGK